MNAIAKTLGVSCANLFERVKGNTKPRRRYNKAQDAALFSCKPVSRAHDMSGLGSTWFVRFLDRRTACCRRFGWRVFWMRSVRIGRDA
jgi:hypothetical protein